MAVFGRYNHIAWSHLVEKGYEPIIEEGDMDILAKGNPDFIAFNYYTSQTVGESLDDGNDFSHTGDQHEIVGEPGAYRGSVNPNLQTTEFGWEIDPVGFDLKELRRIRKQSFYGYQKLIATNGEVR
ncbi:glycoside hydrolase family 1 [Paenibacillus terrae HPL-003]|uniref:Glycoside hydrolase family 1 n=1 Tax=Paenibacillus terrae (strain HPL-003) TaxID=985665 RepID=G7W2F6_PAETH|nr:glycoside hydrolase family 1 [Paenibacillus terrae HPL-003]